MIATHKQMLTHYNSIPEFKLSHRVNAICTDTSSANQPKLRTFTQDMLIAIQQNDFTLDQLAKLLKMHPSSLIDILNNAKRKPTYINFKRLLSLYCATCLTKGDKN